MTFESYLAENSDAAYDFKHRAKMIEREIAKVLKGKETVHINGGKGFKIFKVHCETEARGKVVAASMKKQELADVAAVSAYEKYGNMGGNYYVVTGKLKE